MKILFVPIFSGIEGKNVLRGGIYDALKNRGIKCVFFVGNHTRAAYYAKEYPEATFEVIKRYRRGLIDRLFSTLKFFTLRTKTIDLKRKTNLGKTKQYLRFFASFF